MKQAYEECYDIVGSEVVTTLREIEVLPKCKKVTGLGHTMCYQLVQRKVFFGLINKTYWVDKDNIECYDAPTVEYYNCN